MGETTTGGPSSGPQPDTEPDLRSRPTEPGHGRDALVIAVLVLWTAGWAWAQWTPSGISWHYFADGARTLVSSSGLHVYAQDPTLQIGPLTFVATALTNGLAPDTARAVAQVVATALGPVLVLALAPLVPVERRRIRVLLAGLVVVPAWTVLSVRWAHVDDVLALACTIVAIRAVVAHRSVAAGLAVGAAVACKPWAIGFVPLLLVLDARRRVAGFAAAAVVVAAWFPFFLGDPQTIRALRPATPLSPDSGLWALGYRDRTVPDWGRAVQLVAAPLIGLAAVLRGRWPGLFIAVIAVRLALDPQNLPYYIGGAALAAVVFDLLGTRWTVPWTTVVTVAVLWQPFVADFSTALTATSGWSLWWYSNPTTVGIIHEVWSVAVLAFVLAAPASWRGIPSQPVASRTRAA